MASKEELSSANLETHQQVESIVKPHISNSNYSKMVVLKTLLDVKMVDWNW